MQSEQARIHDVVAGLSEQLSNRESQQAPDPHNQRRAVQAVFANTVNNFHLFYQAAIEAGFSQSRLLSQKLNGLSDVAGLNNYQTEAMVFNTRFQQFPFVIALCESTVEVQFIYSLAIKFNLPIRVRAGGHDHEGECSGDNIILIDVSRIKHFSYNEKDEVATIGAGYRFYQLTPELAKYGRMIAHGTCATVGLTGFIQGGGWGPWTRKYGMCCEHLVGATVVLGNGEVVEVSETCHRDILWALRGGGGMSWGLVTELKVKTFELPDEIHRFEIVWNALTKVKKNTFIAKSQCPTIDVLQSWERVISAADTGNLLGTNLKISAIAKDMIDDNTPYDKLYHPCTMYGYWQGSEKALREFVAKEFASTQGKRKQPKLTSCKVAGKLKGKANSFAKYSYDHTLLSNWARESLADQNIPLHSALDKEKHAFKPDYDAPAPHKITSKLVAKKGLEVQGYKQLLETLTSPLIQADNASLGLFSYVTLGAIVGDYYHNLKESKNALGVSFPYRDALYTIQYQTWWNESIKDKLEQQNNSVYVDTNRAMDWISASRNAQIEGTYGAFISFKDASIPTPVYFQQNYQRLVDIKKAYIKDHYNHLRTRKTII
ncbi:FAD-binding oxidoreductase [Pseudoalteromonas sp. S16_S37]|uniref:FAD-binding oxidoreductase n=1 Tax=Pseudoalteromonas sp. S16_S37 TaxID=2720228 RepID=UPI0016812192|nr:FAD-binding oxidoreductase [Pseudoalteromonas sp. S16_S37]MBD1581523.1 FAD-binding oxidoreductase [Pseudoalteromonas sp. S16_S37]